MRFFKAVISFLGFGVEERPLPAGKVMPAMTAASAPQAPAAIPPEAPKAVKIPVPLDRERTNILIVEPRNLDADAQDILRLLKEGHVLLINNKYLDTPNTRTLMDRVLGVVYAFDGCMQKIGGGIFLCAPRTVNVVDNQQNDVIFNDDFVQMEPPPVAPVTPVQTQYAATGTYSASAAGYTPAQAYTPAVSPAPAYQTARPAGAQSYYY